MAEIGHGHDAVPDGGPPGVVGGDVPGQQRERRQAAQRQDDQGEPVAAVDACRWPGRPATPRRRSCGETYRRWASRLGKKRALVALGHKILRIIYHLLKDRTTYVERPGANQAA